MVKKPLEQASLVVVPAKPSHWPDIEEFFARIPCWCQAWRLSSSEFGRISRDQLREHKEEERKNALRSQLELSTPPGVLA